MRDIHNKIRSLRKQRGLTLIDVAEKVGTDHQHVSRVERGKSKLTVDFLMKLASALDISVDELMEEPQTQNSPLVLDTDLLGVILENIERISEGAPKRLSGKQKAALATCIYQNSFKATVARDPDLLQANFIDCATELIKEILYNH